MQNRFVLHVLLLLYIPALASAQSPQMKQSETNMGTISGAFYAENIYNGAKPVLFVKNDDEIETRYGEIISVDSSGVLFDPKFEGLFIDHDPKLFTYDQVYGLVDSLGWLIYGELPEQYRHQPKVEITLLHATKKGVNPVKIKLFGKAIFEEDVQAGVYTVTDCSIPYTKSKLAIDEKFETDSIIIHPGQQTFIGDLVLKRNQQGAPVLFWNQYALQDTFRLTNSLIQEQMGASRFYPIGLFILGIPAGFLTGLGTALLFSAIGGYDGYNIGALYLGFATAIATPFLLADLNYSAHLDNARNELIYENRTKHVVDEADVQYGLLFTTGMNLTFLDDKDLEMQAGWSFAFAREFYITDDIDVILNFGWSQRKYQLKNKLFIYHDHLGEPQGYTIESFTYNTGLLEAALLPSYNTNIAHSWTLDLFAGLSYSLPFKQDNKTIHVDSGTIQELPPGLTSARYPYYAEERWDSHYVSYVLGSGINRERLRFEFAYSSSFNKVRLFDHRAISNKVSSVSFAIGYRF